MRYPGRQICKPFRHQLLCIVCEWAASYPATQPSSQPPSHHSTHNPCPHLLISFIVVQSAKGWNTCANSSSSRNSNSKDDDACLAGHVQSQCTNIMSASRGCWVRRYSRERPSTQPPKMRLCTANPCPIPETVKDAARVFWTRVCRLTMRIVERKAGGVMVVGAVLGKGCMHAMLLLLMWVVWVVHAQP